MSGWLAGQVWQSALPAKLKPTAAALADIADHDGSNLYPSVAFVSWLTGDHERSTQRHLAALREIGVLEFITDVSDPLKCGRGYTVEYWFNVEALPKRPVWGVTKRSQKNCPSALKERALKAFRLTCVYCQQQGTSEKGPDGQVWHVDRIRSQVDGGTYVPDNIALSCGTCNRQKKNQSRIGVQTLAELEKGANLAPLPDVERVLNETEKGAKQDAERVPNDAFLADLSLNDPPVDPLRNQMRVRATSSTFSPDELQGIWNTHRGPLPKCLQLTASRRKFAKVRISEQPDPAVWETVVKTLAADPGCQGHNKTGWRASFDFLLRPETWLKVVEGHLTRTPQSSNGRPQTANQHRLAVRDANVEHVAAGEFNFPEEPKGES